MAAHLVLQLMNILAILTVGRCSCHHETSRPTEFHIRKHILCAYSSNTQPVNPNKDIMVVQLSLMPEFIDIDEYEGGIILHATTLLEWTDMNLTWNPLEYKNVSFIHIDPALIWTPEFIVAHPTGPKTTFFNPTKCHIRSTGIVTCSWLSMYQIGCFLDYTEWPFDKQYCDLKLGEHIGIHDVNFTVSDRAFIMKWFNPSRTWALIGKNVTVTSSSFKYGFTLQRHSGNYAAAFIYPVICVILLALIPYLMQPNRPQRILFSAASVAGNVVLLKGIGYVMRLNSSTVPKLVYFYRDSLILGILSLFISLGVRILILTKFQPPEWLTVSSQKLLNSCNKYWISIHIQKPVINDKFATSADSHWFHTITILDGIFLVSSSITYIFLMLSNLNIVH